MQLLKPYFNGVQTTFFISLLTIKQYVIFDVKCEVSVPSLLEVRQNLNIFIHILSGHFLIEEHIHCGCHPGFKNVYK